MFYWQYASIHDCLKTILKLSQTWPIMWIYSTREQHFIKKAKFLQTLEKRDNRLARQRYQLSCISKMYLNAGSCLRHLLNGNKK
jgi:hypothetical protein